MAPTMDTDNMRCIFSHINAYLVNHQSLHKMTFADAYFTSLLASSNFQLREHERLKYENNQSCTLNYHWPEFNFSPVPNLNRVENLLRKIRQIGDFWQGNAGTLPKLYRLARSYGFAIITLQR